MSNTGKGMTLIDEEMHARQQVIARCTCGASSRCALHVSEARAWYESHRLKCHPERPDAEEYKRRRRKFKAPIRSAGLTFNRRRDNTSAADLAARDRNMFRPGVDDL